MHRYNEETLLEMVELFAFEVGNISAESELSEVFDEVIAPFVIERYGEDDEPAINESFNNFSDGMCKDGDIHPVQYENYCYVGKYSN